MDIKAALEGAAALDLVEFSNKLPGQTEPAYYRPMTLAQNDKINRELKAAHIESDGEKLAVTLIHSVLDKDGKPVFSLQHKRHLMTLIPADLLVAMVNELGGGPDVAAVEDAEGN